MPRQPNRTVYDTNVSTISCIESLDDANELACVCRCLFSKQIHAGKADGGTRLQTSQGSLLQVRDKGLRRRIRGVAVCLRLEDGAHRYLRPAAHGALPVALWTTASSWGGSGESKSSAITRILRESPFTALPSVFQASPASVVCALALRWT